MYRVEVTGDDRLLRALDGMARDQSDYSRTFRAMSDEVYSILTEQFAVGGRNAGGGRWARLKRRSRSLSALDRRTGVGDNPPSFLTRTYALRKSLIRRGGPQGVYNETRDSLTMGTTIPYAMHHQKGTKNMVARPIFDFGDKDEKRLFQIFRRSLKIQIADRGFDFVAEGPSSDPDVISGDLPF